MALNLNESLLQNNKKNNNQQLDILKQKHSFLNAQSKKANFVTYKQRTTEDIRPSAGTLEDIHQSMKHSQSCF